MITIKDIYNLIANKVMVEDDSPYGGKSFDDETYSDFIFENNISLSSSLDYFDKILKESGFVPVSECFNFDFI
ncbi:hypothetical protein [Peptoniphilus timonensis]|uniref:hypothetical protein n=1 Tax=Peptoniphilus timonensis TaxID=1268254 RepID=UPI000309C34E|nr:hypothetical protein [Peptoniphilus timonensis]